MSDPCSQIQNITESKTHIEHMSLDVKEIKTDVKILMDKVSSMRGFVAGVGAISGICGALLWKLGAKLLGVAAANAMSLIK